MLERKVSTQHPSMTYINISNPQEKDVKDVICTPKMAMIKLIIHTLIGGGRCIVTKCCLHKLTDR